MSDQISVEIRQRLEAFTLELAELYRKAFVSSVQQLIGGSAPAAAPRAPAAPKKRGPRGKRAAAPAAAKPAAAAAKPAAAVAKPAAVAAKPAAVAAKPAAAPAKGKGRGKGHRRSAVEISAMADKVAKHVAANPGLRAEQIKAALGIKSNEWALPIGNLVADGRVKPRGERRATKYFPGK